VTSAPGAGPEQEPPWPGSEVPPGPGPGSGSGSGEPPWSGPWAEDARQLFGLLQQAADRVLGPESGAAEHDPAGHDPSGHATAAECRYCPVCRGLAMVRSNGPEVLDRVAEFAAGLAATLRATQPAPAGEDAGENQGADEEVVVDVADRPAAPRIVPIRID